MNPELQPGQQIQQDGAVVRDLDGRLAAIALASGDRQAVITASAGVDTDQGGCWRRIPARTSGSPTA